jgi:phosphohistidine swiveling domain-containing protein
MKLEKVLDRLEGLLTSWGIPDSDWILVSQYAYRLLGYKVKLREGHFNILVRKKAVPWKIREGVEVHPPRNSIYRQDFKEFIEKTGFDFDINLATDEEFRKKSGKFVIYTLQNKKTIQVQKPEGAVKEFEKLLKLSTPEGFGTERLDKDIAYVKDMIKVLKVKKESKTLKDFQKLLKKFLKAKKRRVKKRIENKKEITGIIASVGRISGRAVIIKGVDDIKKISEGDILVTEMTAPGLTTVLTKISAIVTDKGGRLSHAAILAREMKVPCLVGTQIATKSLRNGDLIEVDAIRGIVRKLGK